MALRNKYFTIVFSVMLILSFVILASAQPPAKVIDEAKAKRAEALFDEGRLLVSNETAVPLRAGLEKLNQAKALYAELNDRENQAYCLSWIGNVHRYLGENNDAIKAWTSSLDLANAVPNDKDRMSMINTLTLNIGGAHQILGNFDKAIEYYGRARDAAEKLQDKTSVAQIMSSTALIYGELGNKERALSLLDEASKLIDPDKDPLNAALIYNSIGVVYLNAIMARPILVSIDGPKALGNFRKAIPLAEISCITAECNRVLIASIINNTGKTLEMLGLHSEAEKLYRESISISELIGDINLKAKSLVNIGSVFFNQKQMPKALEYFNQALPLLEIAGDKSSKATTLAGAMQAWRTLDNPRFAIYYGKLSVMEYQKLRSGIKTFDKSVQQNYLKNIEPAYRILADLLIAEGRIAEAEQVLGMLKDEEVFDYLRREDKVAKDLLQRVSLTEKERSALIRYDSFAANLTTIGKEFGELDQERRAVDEGKFTKQSRYDELKLQLADATTAFQRFLDELKTDFGQKDERVVQVDSSLQNTLQRLKATRTAVVSTIVGEKRLNIIVTTTNAQRAHTSDITSKDLNSLVAEFRKALTNSKIDPRPAGQKLYDILVKPIESDLSGIKADTILWSLDGTLRYIPMAALWDSKKGFLAERFAGAVLTLASRDTLALDVKPKQGWKALGVGVSKETEGFSALTAVPDELDCIVTDAQTQTVSPKPVCKNGVMTGRKLLDDKFTLAAFENALGRYPIVHIASHFQLQPGNDRDSFLLLGGGGQRHFTVENLRSVSLTDVELIVLSACNTATPGGEKANGIEIEGFGAVAQKQGAKSVMATLWPVADHSTRDLMVEFYRVYAKRDVSKAEAIQSAQKAMINGKIKSSGTGGGCRADTFVQAAKENDFKCDPNAPFSHPYFWSPFVLIGNWR